MEENIKIVQIQFPSSDNEVFLLFKFALRVKILCALVNLIRPHFAIRNHRPYNHHRGLLSRPVNPLRRRRGVSVSSCGFRVWIFLGAHAADWAKQEARREHGECFKLNG